MMYSNNILDFQESTTILNAFTKKKKSGNLLDVPRIYVYIYIYIYIYMQYLRLEYLELPEILS